MRGAQAEEDPTLFTVQATDLALSFVNSAEELRSDERIQRGIQAGAKLDRFPLYWNYIEPVAGQFDWSGQDAALQANEAQGLGTLAILLGTAAPYWPRGAGEPSDTPEVGDGLRGHLANPAEAFINCTTPGTPAPTGLFNPIFSDGTDEPAAGKGINPDNPWARFVDLTVNRYRPGGTAGRNVRYWEIWNEQDLCHFWGGTLPEYVRLLKISYLVIKNADPQATVMWGGLALYGPKYQNGANFLTEMVTLIRNDPMSAAHNGFFDVAAVHQYSNVTNSYNYIRRIQNALVGTGWENKGIWVTESGVPVCDSYPGPGCPSPYRANPEEQSSYIWQNIAYTRLANNNGPIFHFQLHDDGGNECRADPPADGFGLVTNEPNAICVPHNAEPRLSYRAYQLAAQYLSNTELLWGDIQDTMVRRVAFYDPASKERRLMIWAIDERNPVANVPATADSARLLSMDGSEQQLTPLGERYEIPVPAATNQNLPNSSTYTIGGKPYLLIETDTQPPTATMSELYPISPPSFELEWEASDLGSGIAPNSVTIWSYAGDDGPWKQVLVNQAAAGKARFEGEPGQRYRFAVLAADRAGNNGSQTVVMAETLITDGNQQIQLSGQVRKMSGQPAAWARVTVGERSTLADTTGNFNLSVPMGQWDVAVQGNMQKDGMLFMENHTLSLVLPPTSNAVQNGDFEQESGTAISGWQKGGSSPAAQEEVQYSRDNILHLATNFVADPFVPGSEGSNGGNSTLSQVLTVSSDSPYLSLAYKVESEETDGGNGSCGNPEILHDKFEVIIINGVQADYIHCQEGASGWQQGFFDLSQHAGQKVTLIINLYQSSPNRPTSAQIDLVMIGKSPSLAPLDNHIFLPVVTR
jgi:hypothetical protein